MFQVEDCLAGREQFAVGMERSGGCRALLWGECLTAAMVARSLLAAFRSSWLVGVLVGVLTVRRDWVWPVSWDVVVAVDM